MRIYADERARNDKGPLYRAIVERARAAKIAGADIGLVTLEAIEVLHYGGKQTISISGADAPKPF